MGAIITLLPVILQSLGAVYHEVSDGRDDGTADRTIKIASEALAGVPEAVESFMKLKDALGGKAPTADDLRAVLLEIQQQGAELEQLRQEAHAREDAGEDGN